MGKGLADKVKQVTAFNLAGAVFEGFGGLACVLLKTLIVFPQVTCLLFPAILKD